MLVLKKFDSIFVPKEKPFQPNMIPITNKLYRVAENTEYHLTVTYTHKNKKCTGWFTLRVSEGYINDGQSVPRILWSVSGMRPDGLVRKAAFWHDPLYHTKGGRVKRDHVEAILLDGLPVHLGRKACDQIYKAVYIDSDPTENKAKLGYGVLRSCGWFYWGREITVDGIKR